MAAPRPITDYPIFLRAIAIRPRPASRAPAALTSPPLNQGGFTQATATDAIPAIFAHDRRSFEAALARLQSEAEPVSAVVTHQRAHSTASKARARAAHVLHQQRRAVLRSDIRGHEAALAALAAQLRTLRAGHAAQHALFDVQDAIDLQLEDERRLPAAAVAARHERERARAFDDAMLSVLHTEVASRNARIDLAKTQFEKSLRRECISAARVSLRELKQLKLNGAYAGHGEKKFAFWNSVRRALTKEQPSAQDVKVYEAYVRELERPVLDGVSGMPPETEVMDEFGVEFMARDGLFSITGFQYEV